MQHEHLLLVLAGREPVEHEIGRTFRTRGRENVENFHSRISLPALSPDSARRDWIAAGSRK